MPAEEAWVIKYYHFPTELDCNPKTVSKRTKDHFDEEVESFNKELQQTVWNNIPDIIRFRWKLGKKELTEYQ